MLCSAWKYASSFAEEDALAMQVVLRALSSGPQPYFSVQRPVRCFDDASPPLL
jgi:hypothetical protein